MVSFSSENAEIMIARSAHATDNAVNNLYIQLL